MPADPTAKFTPPQRHDPPAKLVLELNSLNQITALYALVNTNSIYLAEGPHAIQSVKRKIFDALLRAGVNDHELPRLEEFNASFV